MLKRKAIKFIALTVALVMSMSLLAGCKKTGTSGQVVRYNLGAEPKTIDPALNSATDGSNVILNTFEGLTRLDNNDQPVAGVAEKWEVSADQLTYKFFLRKDAKWSDGQPVKAQDFEYAWKRVLNPETAAEYAYMLYYIKNGEAYNSGKATADQVAVKALDDYTLEVTLEAPTSYFLSLTAFPTYSPVRKDIVEVNKDTWATKPETYISNGPFVLKEWRPKDVMVLEKNTNYWKANEVKLGKVEFKMIDQQTSALTAFQTGQLDMIDNVPQEEIPRLVKEKIATIEPALATYYYIFNLTDKAATIDPAASKALKDPKVRKALTLAVDRKAIVDNVTKGGQTPAGAMVPGGIKEPNGQEFRNVSYYKPEGDVAEAKKLLAEAGYPEGKGFPKLTILYNTSQGHQNIAQAIQDMWKKNLGINVELKNEEWKVFQTTRRQKNYLVARAGWNGDYVDPMTFLDMWTTGNPQNDAGYANAAFDAKIAAAKKEVDPAKRMQILHEAEEILMTDLPIMPIYFYTHIVCVKSNVKGIHKSVLGHVYFDNAYVEGK